FVSPSSTVGSTTAVDPAKVATLPSFFHRPTSRQHPPAGRGGRRAAGRRMLFDRGYAYSLLRLAHRTILVPPAPAPWGKWGPVRGSGKRESRRRRRSDVCLRSARHLQRSIRRPDLGDVAAACG